MNIILKRAYETSAASDNQRILVDRLWSRGLNKETADIDFWAKSIAPSTELRRWYNHDEKKWPEFKQLYFRELEANNEGVEELLQQISKDRVTFIFSSKEPNLNNAAALKEFLEGRRGNS